ncbi:MAG TPA: DoxX family protein [Pseudolabrys sp.]
MTAARLATLRTVLRLVMAVFFLGGFVLHMTALDALVAITPGWVPFPRAVALITGWLELAGALGLLLPRTRRAAGIALALFILAVWPANIHQAVAHIVVPPIPDSWWYHGPRLALQPVLVWWALFCTGVIDWPAAGPKRNGQA